MFRRKSSFPWHLFVRFVLGQLAIAVPGTALVLWLMSESGSLWATGVGIICVVAVSALFMGYQMVLPLGRILLKMRAMLREEASGSARSPFDDEWSDVQNALEKIQHSMRGKDVSLVREREGLAAIMSALSQPVLAVDRDGNVLFFNSQFLVRFGGQEKRQGQRFKEYFRDPNVLEAFDAVMGEGRVREINASLPVKGATLPHHFALSIAPLRGDEENPERISGAVGVFHDVTELKRLDQVRVDFVANVSHELRSPLTSIKGYADTLRQDLEAENAKGDRDAKVAAAYALYLGKILQNVNRLIFLVNDLLQLSSLDAGADLNKAKIAVRDFTDKILLQLETKAKEKGLVLRGDLEGVDVLWADPMRLEQVMVNLVENAIKYAPAGKEIRILWTKGEGGKVLLHVIDKGPGIAEEHHARLFERFYRVDSSRSREMGGTGLGLAIVKHIMQRHAGTVAIKSQLGRGTEFICTFPQ